MSSQVWVFTAFGDAGTEKIIQRAEPAPGRGQIAIRVVAAGVNPVDWKVRAGLLGKDRSLPAPMGQEAAGVVTAVGEDVEGFAVGDEVLGPVADGLGAFAEHTVLSAATAVQKPEGVSFVDAATLPVAGATAYDLTHQVELEAGQSMLIIGAGGGIGLMVAQIGAVHKFAVIGVAGAAKRELVEAAGAMFIPSGDDAAELVRAAAPDGLDLIIDLVGGDALRQLAGLAKDQKHVVSAADSATVAELGGVAVARSAESLEKITEVVEYGLVDPHVRQQFSLADARDAIAAVESGHAAGKVVVVP